VGRLTFTLKEQPSVPLEAESLSPDTVENLKLGEISALPVYLGKRQRKLGDFFSVEGEASSDMEIHGDLSRVKWVGHKMTHGSVTVHGNVGMHVGAYMLGGTITVHGNASDWVGGEMQGGLIRIDGHAGGQVGAAYRGSVAGMRDGIILIGGNAGNEVGMRMKRGIIAIKGQARDFAGLQMKGGTIFLLGGAGIRTGAWMSRGTIVSGKPLTLMPTFLYNCVLSPTFLRLYYKYLEELGFLSYKEIWDSAPGYEKYSGDTSIPGKGEILVLQSQPAQTAA
jgi:formylmethanofuran dehydrogenase subunit C